MAGFSIQEKVDLLLKKSLGKASALPKSGFFAEEASHKKISASQIRTSIIPPSVNVYSSGTTVASNLDLLTQGNAYATDDSFVTYFHKWPMSYIYNANIDYPSFKAATAASSGITTLTNTENPLENSIQSSDNFKIKLYLNDGSYIGDPVGDWVVDNDAGILTFYDITNNNLTGTYKPSDTKPPKISFYAYTGNMGLGGLVGSSGGTILATSQNKVSFAEPIPLYIEPNITSGTTAFQVKGDVLVTSGANNATGIISATLMTSVSDQTLKKNVKTIENPMKKINAVNGVTFDWKDGTGSSAGVIAQEVEAIIPECVKEINGIKTVNYDCFIPYLIESMKEQEKEHERTRERINELEKKISINI